MDKENAIISHFASKKNGDDGALIGQLVYSKDLFAQNSHFKKGWLNSRQIGVKSMLVNISDAIAMNAEPRFALLGLGVPKNASMREISELCAGINETAREFGIEIVGGDTIKSNEFMVSITIISQLRGIALTRKGVKTGDLLCFSGKIGTCLRDLRALQNRGSISKNSRFIRPVLRAKFVYDAAKFMRCAMDISDGLASDLPKICGAHGVKFSKKLSKFELQSGEEYEILFACSPKKLPRIQAAARKNRVKITPFGKIIKGKCKIYGKFSHF